MVNLQTSPIPKNLLPTMYDLPSEDPEEPGLPDEFHDFQPELLSFTCQPPSYWPQNCFCAADLNLYYDLGHQHWYKRPDWFVVLGKSPSVEQEKLRLSYVIWQEEIPPYLVVELLSPGTEKEDKGKTQRQLGEPPTKWEVYEQILQIPYYVIYDRYENDWRVFRLEQGKYQEERFGETPGSSLDRLWLPQLELGLGLWQGCYKRVEGLWLRFYDHSGQWIPTPSEEADRERERSEQERLRAAREKARAAREKLKAARARARAEQEKARAEQEKARAEQEKARAEQEKIRAEQERVRATLTQAQLEQTEVQLEQTQAMLAEERRKQEALRDPLQAMGIDPDQLI